MLQHHYLHLLLIDQYLSRNRTVLCLLLTPFNLNVPNLERRMSKEYLENPYKKTVINSFHSFICSTNQMRFSMMIDNSVICHQFLSRKSPVMVTAQNKEFCL